MTAGSETRSSTRFLAPLGFGRGEAAVAITFLVFTAGMSLALFPGRVHVPLFVIVTWGSFFTLMLRMGYGWLALNGALVFWLLVHAELLNHDITRSFHVAVHLCLAIGLVAVGAVGHRLVRGRAVLAVLALQYAATVALAVAALFYIWHITRFGARVTESVVYAILQTHAAELNDFVSEFADGRMFLWAVLVAWVPAFLLYRQCVAGAGRGDWRIPALLAAIPLALAFYYHAHLRVLDMLVTSVRDYRREVALFRALRDSRAAGETVVHGEKDETGETYVIVLGESLNRNQMQLYGYHRATTPLLDSLFRAGELIRFSAAYATHTHTARVLPPALTAMNQRNGLTLAESPSLLEVAEAAGYDTYWITNQVLYGSWDNLVSIIAHDADSLVRLNVNVGATTSTQQHDEAAVMALQQLLRQPTGSNRLAVVHLMGSHWQYCDRYPQAFGRFRGDSLPRGEFGSSREGYLATALNCYDNSVLYGDHVVAELLRVVREAGGVSALAFIADHGEDVLNGHGHHAELFTFPMVDIPFVMWLSHEYRERYAGRVANLEHNADAVFPSDFLFDTAIGLAGIRSVHHDSLADLTSAAFRSDDVPLGTVEGRHRLDDPANFAFHQRANIGRLLDLGQLSRVIPHRVNSIGMLSQAVYDGYRSMELDLLYRGSDHGGHFEPGHDEASRSGNDLADILQLLPTDPSARLWLDLKNLGVSNAPDVTATLLHLDREFGLKRRTLVESPAVEQLVQLQRAGFHTSWYLPTERLLALIEADDRNSLAHSGLEIAGRVRETRVAAVSFDHRLYPFVKQYVEPHLPTGTAYHTWNLRLSLSDPDFVEQLHDFDAFSDPRVQTILVRYVSELML